MFIRLSATQSARLTNFGSNRHAERGTHAWNASGVRTLSWDNPLALLKRIRLIKRRCLSLQVLVLLGGNSALGNFMRSGGEACFGGVTEREFRELGELCDLADGQDLIFANIRGEPQLHTNGSLEIDDRYLISHYINFPDILDLRTGRQVVLVLMRSMRTMRIRGGR
uniref:Phosphoglycerate kinase n=1 Tax=Steinernema glaseri TaxID=37863 RepID=A0A1I8AVL5_9BILA